MPYRRRCKVERVVPCGAANIVNCNGVSPTASATVVLDDDDDDVICLDDEPIVRPSLSQHSSRFVTESCTFHSPRWKFLGCIEYISCRLWMLTSLDRDESRKKFLGSRKKISPREISRPEICAFFSFMWCL